MKIDLMQIKVFDPRYTFTVDKKSVQTCLVSPGLIEISLSRFSERHKNKLIVLRE